LAIGPFHIGLLDAGFDEPHNPPAEDEQIADLKLFNEVFLDRAEPSSA
jgi:hypothetical protein